MYLVISHSSTVNIKLKLEYFVFNFFSLNRSVLASSTVIKKWMALNSRSWECSNFRKSLNLSTGHQFNSFSSFRSQSFVTSCFITCNKVLSFFRRVSSTTCTAAGRVWSTASREPPMWWSLVKLLWLRDTVTWVKAASRLCVGSALASSSPRSTPSTPCRPPWRVGDDNQQCIYTTNISCKYCETRKSPARFQSLPEIAL